MEWHDRIAPPISDPARLEPAHLWVIGLTPNGTPLTGVRRRHPFQDAQLAIRDDCRCPDDCGRDHPNE